MSAPRSNGAAPEIEIISASAYSERQTGDKHVFLAGNLQRPQATPFLRDERLEWIVCRYEPGDDGLPHWHAEVTEYETVTSGEVGYFEIATERTHWFREGDFFRIPSGVCVRRLVRERSSTIAIKVPSSAEKIHCAECSRECRHRLEPFQPNKS